MIALEDQLRAALGRSARVDGHDGGSGETNIFIITDDPARAFARARPALERAGCLASARVAYRHMAGEEYTVLWPEGSTGEFAVRYTTAALSKRALAWKRRVLVNV